MISAGSLDRKITLQQRTITRDASGGAVEVFVNRYLNVPAKEMNSSGREKYHAESDREIAYDRKRFLIRYIAGLDKTFRFVYEGLYYDILAIEPTPERRQGLYLTGQLAE